MKFTLNEAIEMTEGLNEILTKEVTVKAAYWLARFLEKVSSEMKAMEKARMKLIEKYAEKDKDGKPLFKKDKDGNSLNQYDISNENAEKFSKEFEELKAEEFDIEFNPIKIDQLGDIKLKPLTLVQLAKIIVE